MANLLLGFHDLLAYLGVLVLKLVCYDFGHPLIRFQPLDVLIEHLPDGLLLFSKVEDVLRHPKIGNSVSEELLRAHVVVFVVELGCAARVETRLSHYIQSFHPLRFLPDQCG